MKKVYLMGIGGCGMSSLALILKDKGIEVLGSDLDTDSIFVEELKKRGIKVVGNHEGDEMTDDIDFVCYSNALRNLEDKKEYKKAKELKIPTLNYPKLLGKVVDYKKVIGVAGTHGKSTTSGMISEILSDSGASFLVGAKILNLDKQATHKKDDLFVIEADEYMGSFLEYPTNMLCINNLEHDHFDCYSSKEEYLDIFKKKVESMDKDSVIFTDGSCKEISSLLEGTDKEVIDYRKYIKKVPKLKVFGDYNIENAAVAYAVCDYLGIDEKVIEEKLAAFSGVSMRGEVKGKIGNTIFIDDYAHHPTAISRNIKGIRESFKGKEINVIVQIHQFSRLHNRYEDYRSAFVDADRVFLLPVYPAREKDEPDYNYNKLKKDIENYSGVEVFLVSPKDVKEKISEYVGEDAVFVVQSASKAFNLIKGILEY